MSIKKLKQGDKIVFKGYGDDVPEDQQFLTAGDTYEIADVDVKEKKVSVEIDNPEFNAKKKESDDNPKRILIDVFEEEFDVAEDAPAEEAAPAKAKTVTRTKPGANKVTAKPAAASKAAKTAAKPAKGKATDEAEADAEEEVETLETEDAEVLKMVKAAEKEDDGILGLAKELVEKAAAQDYQLGGVLYHVRLSKAYHELDERYKERGGFGLYVKEQLNIEYRKAMYLVDIYVKFNKFGIDADKVAQIGWTKASKIAAVMTEDNAEELVDLAEENSVADLSENIKVNYAEKGGTKGEKKKVVVFRFRLFQDSAEVVQAALEAAAAALGYKKLDEAFEHIVTEWATEHPMKPAAKAAEGRKVSAGAKAPAKVAPAARPAARSAARPAATK